MPWNQPQARGSRGLANGGMRALGEARKANFTLQRNLRKKVLLLGCVGLGSLGRYLGCSWPGESGPGQWKPRARQRWTESPGRGQESQFHIPAKFVHLRCSWSAVRSAGWAGLGASAGKERSVAGQGKPRARQRGLRALGEARKTNFTLHRNL